MTYRVNRLVPAVLIQSVKRTIDLSRAEASSFRTDCRILAIRSTALSLQMPERVRFRYMLEASIRTWQEAGTRREGSIRSAAGKLPVPYRRLQQRRRLEPVGSTYEFQRRPRLLSDKLVHSSCRRFSSLLLLSGLYNFDCQRVGRQLHVRYEERLAERTRIAARAAMTRCCKAFRDWFFDFRQFATCFPGKPSKRLAHWRLPPRPCGKAITRRP